MDKMRVLIPAAVLVLAFAGLSSGMDIDRAVIYDDQAVITFSSRIDGFLSFDAPGEIIPESLLVRPREGGRVESVSMEPARTESGAAGALREELGRAQTDLALKRRELAYLDRQIDTIFQSLVSRDRPASSRQQLAEILGFMDERVPALNRKAVETLSAITGLETRVKDLQARLASLGDRPGLLVRVKGSGRADVTYAVKPAAFRPEYRIHAWPDSSTIVIDCLATLSQTTGMDWDIRELWVATGRPGHGIHAPELVPWFVGQRQRVLDKASAVMMEAVPMVSAAPENDTIPEVRPTGTTTILGAARNVKLPGDGTPATVRLASIRQEAAFSSVTVPKHSERAYLRARTTLAGDVPLVEGRYSSFVDGVYTGSAELSRYTPGQEMAVDLGEQEGILVRRTKKKAFHEKTITGKDRTTYAYEIAVENKRSGTIRIAVKDQIPVSRDESVEVRLIETNPRTLPDENGFLSWETDLDPNERRTFEFRFSVTGMPFVDR